MRAAMSGILLALGLSCAAAAAQDAIALQVDTAQPGAKIDRHIFGQFMEQLGTQIYNGVWVGPHSKIPNVHGIRKDVVAALRELHVPDVRWPGGCYADQYHWRDGVGKTRTTRINTSWGDVLDTNAFGTDEYFDFLRQIGAQAYISVNLGSGTVEEAADWLEYMTADKPTTLAKQRAANGHPAPYKVAFLGLGNESWDCGGLMTPTEYTARMRRFARFVNNLNPAEKMAKIAVGPGGPDTDWTDAVMSTWQKRHGWSFDIDGMSLHSYTVFDGWPPHMPSTDFGKKEYAEVLKETLKMNGLLDQQSAEMDKYDPEKKISLVVDEWGTWLAPMPGSNPHFLQQQNSLRDAILAALNLNIFARHADRVRMANIAQMVNVLQAMLMTDGPKMVRTPTYYVFKMYVPFQDAVFLPVAYDAGTYTEGDVTLPRIDAIAAKTKDGKIVVSLTNLDPDRPADFAVAVPGATAAHGEVLTAPKVNSVNTFAAPGTVVPKPVSAEVADGKLSVALPPASVTVLTLQ
ncbi:MAG: alpha-N-arabinofuranosidase [Alphaproteobacteria bacterium]|nr:alpha-N-arabinofuranosidase [Alphaproteobacteria bacterium]MDE2495626.1 alpha-N-arabinofuranosidase [Alphaproteobacteria bacterium]